MRTVLLVGCAAVLFSACGCEAFRLSRDEAKLPPVSVEYSPLSVYLEDRLLDILDCFILNISAGPGFLINARATKLGQAGVGIAKYNKYGFVGRSLGRWMETRTEIGVSLFYLSNSVRQPLVYNRFLYDWCIQSERDKTTDIDMFRAVDRDFFDIAVSVHVLFGGIEIGFRLREFADFLLGIVTIDFRRTIWSTAPVASRSPAAAR